MGKKGNRMSSTYMKKADSLDEIKEEFMALMSRAKEILRDTHEADIAHVTWLAEIRMALDADHDYLARSARTMQKTIDELYKCADDEFADEVDEAA